MIDLGLVQLLERAVAAATMLLAASEADSVGASQAGEAIDEGTAAVAHEAAVSFTASAAAAAAAFLPRLMVCPVNVFHSGLLPLGLLTRHHVFGFGLVKMPGQNQMS